ncbi:hypothetical protein F5Y09DRAFT_133842 [Xylaria sp. FL1042]|nr:hypothetical protein F5Y09DRAFT_133842 [Xylaria sp. FL1042]
MSRFPNYRKDGSSNQPISCFGKTQPKEPLQSSTMSRDDSDWVTVHSPTTKDNICRAPSTEDKIDPVLPAPPHSAPPSSNTNINSMKPDVTTEHSKEIPTETPISRLKRDISYLKYMQVLERGLSYSLGKNLCDLLNIVTQSQRHELVRLQTRLLDIESDPKDCLAGQERRDLQNKLHNLDHQLEDYIKDNIPEIVSRGMQSPGLTRFLKDLSGELPKMWDRLETLELKLKTEDSELSDSVYTLFSDEPTAKRDAADRASRECSDSANVPTLSSMPELTHHQYDFSRLQRKVARRKEKLQAVLDDISTQLGRFQTKLIYEERRTANMGIRMVIWGDDSGASKIKLLSTLRENLEIKQAALKHGSQELEKTAAIVQELPSYFRTIDMSGLGEDRMLILMHPKSSAMVTKQESGTAQDCVGVADQREDTLCVAELEAKSEEKEANEKPRDARFEDLDQGEEGAKAALQEQLTDIEPSEAGLWTLRNRCKEILREAGTNPGYFCVGPQDG